MRLQAQGFEAKVRGIAGIVLRPVLTWDLGVAVGALGVTLKLVSVSYLMWKLGTWC